MVYKNISMSIYKRYLRTFSNQLQLLIFDQFNNLLIYSSQSPQIIDDKVDKLPGMRCLL